MVEIIKRYIKWILLILLLILFIIFIINIAGNGSKKVKSEIKKNVEIIKEETTIEDEPTESITPEEPIQEIKPQEVNTPDTATNEILEEIIGIIILSGTTYYIYHKRKLYS